MELSNDSWKSIDIHNKKYSIRLKEENGRWNIFLTDLRNIWFERLEENEIVEKCEKLNPNLSIEDVDVLEIVAPLFDNVEKNAVKKSIERIEFAKDFEGGIFKFSIDFALGNAQLFCEQVTMPLCLLAGEFQRRQEILLNLIKKKDEEITEYELNGAELIRKNIKTKPFCANLFNENAPKLNSDNILNTFQTVMRSKDDIEFEIVTIKTESITTSLPEESKDDDKTENLDETMKSEFEDNTIDAANKKNVNIKSEENDDFQDASETLSKIEKKDSPKLMKKKAKSVSLHSKRLKKTINDFIA